jgi:hypothetical protein
MADTHQGPLQIRIGEAYRLEESASASPVDSFRDHVALMSGIEYDGLSSFL